MVRRNVFVFAVLGLLLSFAMACGGSGDGDDGTQTPTPSPSGTQTVQPGDNPAFALYEPSGPTILVKGQTFRLRWNASNYSSNLVLRVALDTDTDPTSVSEWFPMSYGNGSNYLDWDTSAVEVGTYYFQFELTDGANTQIEYSPSVTVQNDSPYTIPPTVQLINPVASTAVYPATPIDVTFKVGNADANSTSVVGIDDDKIYSNGITTWLPIQYVGPGTYSFTWDTTPFANDEYYIVVKATNGDLDTYAYSQKITIADIIDFGDAPVIEYQLPTDAILVTQGEVVSVRYTLTDPDSFASARFILDSDDNIGNGWMEVLYNEVQEGVHTFDWNTIGVEPGIYFFLVIATDENNQTQAYSPAIIVNPVGQLTSPPNVYISKPSQPLIVPIGAPLSIEGTVIDTDSEAIVQVGIDDDDNFGNGVIGWLATTFTGNFAVNWITTYYDAGFYHVVVKASDGVNETYQYTDIIELRYLMPPGWTTNKLRLIKNATVFDGLDSVGAYHALHDEMAGTAALYQTTNRTGNWQTRQLMVGGTTNNLYAEFDASDIIHAIYTFGSFNKTAYTVTTLESPVARPITPFMQSEAVGLDIIPEDGGRNDDMLAATLNGSNLRLYYCTRDEPSVTRRIVWQTDDAVSGYSNFYGKLHFDTTGTGHIITRLSDTNSGDYPVYYFYGSGNSWSNPVELVRPNVDTYGIRGYFSGTEMNAIVQTTNDILHFTCSPSGTTSESILPELDPGDPAYNIGWSEIKIVNGVPQVLYRSGTELYYVTHDGADWTHELVGTILQSSDLDWISDPSGRQYIFASTSATFGAFRKTQLGWSFETIITGMGFLPSGDFAPNGDIVCAFRTTALGEQRVNFARKLNTTGEWTNEKLANDSNNILPFKCYVNKANNIYIRYLTTDGFLTVLTFR